MQKPELVKDACKIFKSEALSCTHHSTHLSNAEILMYQGLLEHEESDPMVIAREIVSEGIRDGQLRDEIYCQICKQTCYTPTEYISPLSPTTSICRLLIKCSIRELLFKGWELMIFSCLTFPPTQNFEEWLRKCVLSYWHIWHSSSGSDAQHFLDTFQSTHDPTTRRPHMQSFASESWISPAEQVLEEESLPWWNFVW